MTIEHKKYHYSGITQSIPVQLFMILPWLFLFAFLWLWYAYQFEGVHIASTDNLFSTFGHGSCPKLLFDIVTEHLCCPMHLSIVKRDYTFSNVEYEVGAWQVPCWKVPHFPRGVPKLAKFDGRNGLSRTTMEMNFRPVKVLSLSVTLNLPALDIWVILRNISTHWGYWSLCKTDSCGIASKLFKKYQ